MSEETTAGVPGAPPMVHRPVEARGRGWDDLTVQEVMGGERADVFAHRPVTPRGILLERIGGLLDDAQRMGQAAAQHRDYARQCAEDEDALRVRADRVAEAVRVLDHGQEDAEAPD